MFRIEKKSKTRIITLGFLLVLGLGILRFGSYEPKQEGAVRTQPECRDHKQQKYDNDGFEIIEKDVSCTALKSIKDSYKTTIKPIFEAKCLMCHGEAQRLPLYAAVPPARFLVQSDIREAKKHMNMTHGFPFEGHGSEVDDLKAIRKIIEKNQMPPWQYKLMHWRSAITEQERQRIFVWVEQSLKVIQSKGEEK